MKRIILFLSIIALCGCHDTPIGYLTTDKASYAPDVKTIFTDESKIPAAQLANKAPWITNMIEGVLGTAPIVYSIANIEASEGGNAETFRQELVIRGMGIMEVPLRPASPKGKYVVSIRIKNDGYTHILNNVYTFIIE